MSESFMDAIDRNGYEIIHIPLVHPACSPDLASSDYVLFPNANTDIRRWHCRPDEEVTTSTEEQVDGKDPEFFDSGMMALEYHRAKCIMLEGNYTEKKRSISNGYKEGLFLFYEPSYDETYIRTRLQTV